MAIHTDIIRGPPKYVMEKSHPPHHYIEPCGHLGIYTLECLFVYPLPIFH